MNTLADELPRELERNRELLKIYEEIGPAGQFGHMMISRDIAAAEQAMMRGDVVAMIQIYARLKENK